MNRAFILIYGVVSYLVGCVGLVCFVLFVGGWEFLPWSIDSGAPTTLNDALLTNVLLIALFAAQHSMMARPAFKKRLTAIIAPPMERSTYVILSGAALLVICWFWQPTVGELWRIDHPAGWATFVAVHCFGWLLVGAAAGLRGHLELFGVEQSYRYYRNQPEKKPKFNSRGLHGIVRHPLQLGVLIGLWATPVMSLTHFMLASLMSVYIFLGMHLEERDLAATFGGAYEKYRRKVPMVIPFAKFPTTGSH